MDVRHSAPSDLESVKTEDFENQFHSLMIKRASPTTGVYHQIVGTNLDPGRSRTSHNKYQSVLSKNFRVVLHISENSYVRQPNIVATSACENV